jgi:hypothetical protein
MAVLPTLIFIFLFPETGILPLWSFCETARRPGRAARAVGGRRRIGAGFGRAKGIGDNLIGG